MISTSSDMDCLLDISGVSGIKCSRSSVLVGSGNSGGEAPRTIHKGLLFRRIAGVQVGFVISLYQEDSLEVSRRPGGTVARGGRSFAACGGTASLGTLRMSLASILAGRTPLSSIMPSW